MPDYPHLKLPYKIVGLAKPAGRGGPKTLQQTQDNLNNRGGHGNKLVGQVNNLRATWDEFRQFKAKGQSSLPNDIDIPIFIKVDPNGFPDLETFRHWGVQIIAEEKDGYLLGVSNDGFAQFEGNLNEFLAQKGRRKDTAAKIWEIADNETRIQQLLKGDLKEVWGDIDDATTYTVELGVQCLSPIIETYPESHQFEFEETYFEALNVYRAAEQQSLIQRDALQIRREEEIAKYVGDYNAVQHEEWDNGTDAVYFKLAISGSGLRDLVFTYQYLFKISFPAAYNVPEAPEGLPAAATANIIPPNPAAPSVCVIDSGIQEAHVLLAPAITPAESFSYVHGEAGVEDLVRISGHGTKVAGACLYPRSIPVNEEYQLVCRIQNAKILNQRNEISDEEFGPALMEKIVARYEATGTRIFNLSVTEKCCYDGTHMPELAGSIDKLMHEKNILFIIAAGNTPENTGSMLRPGINELVTQGMGYPNFMDHAESKIANPGTSSFAITVGSVGHANYEDADVIAVAGKDQIAPFSRTGFGMWGAIKPDVVEYGGDLVRNKISGRISQNPNTNIELVNSTLYNAAAHGTESYGTSFSTPKVSHIAAQLQAEHPTESSRMYKALIIQSARLPANCFANPTTLDFCRYGYGIPDLNRALNNTPGRITYIQEGRIGAKKADIYKLVIPSELRGENQGFQLLVEITMTFTAKTRATRKGAHSYMSTWLDWKSCKYRENFNSFRARTLQYLEEEQEQELELEAGDKAIQWVVRENPKYNDIKVNRNYSATQKSWAIIQPHQFAEDFSIAVIGHAGWDKNLDNTVGYSLAVSFESVGAEIPLYQLMAEAQIPIETETDLEIEL